MKPSSPLSAGARMRPYLMLSELSGALVTLIGLMALAGWAFNIDILKSILPGLVSMKANTAVCFILTGVSLLLQQARYSNNRIFSFFGKACAFIVMLVGAVTLYEYVSGHSLKIDLLLFNEAKNAIFTAFPGRMAFITALSFMLTGIALLFPGVKTKRGYYPSQMLAMSAQLIAFLAFLGYLYGVSVFYDGIATYTAMALPTIIGFILAGAGILFARPDGGLAGVMTSEYPGGIIMRRLLVPVIIISPLLGWLRICGEKCGLYNRDFGVMLTVVGNIVIITAILWWTAASINNIAEKARKAQDNLDLSNSQWAKTFDAISDFIFILDKDFRILNCNSSFANAFHVRQEDIIGKKCHEVVHAKDAPWEECPFEETVADGRTHTREVNDPRVGIPLLVTTSPLFDGSGHVAGAVHIARDMSEAKKSSKALEESENKYRVLFDSSADAIMTLEPGGRFLSCNNATLKLFGCGSEKQFASLTPADLSPEYQPDGETSAKKSRDMMDIAIKNGSYYFEWKHKRLDGMEFFASVLLTRVTVDREVILQATVRDITARKQLEEELKDKILELERFQKITIGRELKMKELKSRIAQLESMMGGNK